ncbi:hypothetical protein A6S26_32335 [Nostoc sp. ATCC 43529]|nr:hypothetical protein A6S26_32335 [Nostoc sp. ATCC 43529]
MKKVTLFRGLRTSPEKLEFCFILNSRKFKVMSNNLVKQEKSDLNNYKNRKFDIVISSLAILFGLGHFILPAQFDYYMLGILIICVLPWLNTSNIERVKFGKLTFDLRKEIQDLSEIIKRIDPQILERAFTEADKTLIQYILQLSPRNRQLDENLDEILLKLAEGYNNIPDNLLESDKTTEKTSFGQKMRYAASQLERLKNFSINPELCTIDEENKGKLLAIYSHIYEKYYLYNNENLLNNLVDSLSKVKDRFVQYWGIKAIDKIIRDGINFKINNLDIINKLQRLLEELQDKSTDRKFLLKSILDDYEKFRKPT